MGTKKNEDSDSDSKSKSILPFDPWKDGSMAGMSSQGKILGSKPGEDFEGKELIRINQMNELNKVIAGHGQRRLAHLDVYEHSSPVPLALFLMLFVILGMVWLRRTMPSAEPKKNSGTSPSRAVVKKLAPAAELSSCH